MANVTFNVEPSKLLSTATQFQSTSNTVYSTIDRMIQLVHETGCQWCGSAADTYRRKFDQHDADRRDIKSLIDEHVKDLQEIAKNFVTTDQNLSQNASGLRVDVVH